MCALGPSSRPWLGENLSGIWLVKWPFGSARFILVKVQFPEWSLLLDIGYKTHYGSGIGIVKLLPKSSALPSGPPRYQIC